MTDSINTKEKLLVEYLCSNRELFLKCYRILEPKYFDEPLNQVVEFIKNYFDAYSSCPDFDIIEADTGVSLKQKENMDKDVFNYVLDEIENHCKQQAMRIAILDSVTDVETNNFGAVEKRIRDAMMVSINTDIGLNIFDDPSARLHRMMTEIDYKSSGLSALDRLINGYCRKELGIFAAGTSGGKSVMLANIASHMARDKLNVLVVSLEMYEDKYARRFDTIITGIPIKEIFNNIEKVDQTLKAKQNQYGTITVKHEPRGTNINQIRSLVMEYHLINGYYPDVLIVDYVDLMGVRDKKLSGKFDQDEEKTHDLRDFIIEMDMYGFTASQLNREAVNVTDIHYGMIAGGLSKVNASDFTIAMYQTEEDVDAMILNFCQLKVRDSEKNLKHVQAYRCPMTLRITDTPPKSINTVKTSSPLVNKTNQPKKKLKNALKQSTL